MFIWDIRVIRLQLTARILQAAISYHIIFIYYSIPLVEQK